MDVREEDVDGRLANQEDKENSWISEDEDESDSLEYLCDTFSPLRLSDGLPLRESDGLIFKQSPVKLLAGLDSEDPTNGQKQKVGKKKTWSNRVSRNETPLKLKTPTISSPFAKRPPQRFFFDLKTKTDKSEFDANDIPTDSRLPTPLSTPVPCCSSTPITHTEESSTDKAKRWKLLNRDSLKVINRMQEAGFLVDVSKTKRMERYLLDKMVRTERKIFALAKERFNLDSATEVSRVLFVKMKLPVPNSVDQLYNRPKRHFSTSKAVLKQIAHPIASHILKWRQMEHSLSVSLFVYKYKLL